jgi:shikimate kinase
MVGGDKSSSGNNIYLIGFMAAGKSTVGRLLAKKLDRPFFDTDEVIQQRTGKSIRQIFAEGGEASFRKIEAEAVCEVTQQRGAVVAFGGGAILSPVNWQSICGSGISFYLKWEISMLVQRLMSTGDRPLVSGDDDQVKAKLILELFDRRASLYLRATHTISCTPKMSAENIVDDIITRLGKKV